ncbi:MAG TPA: SDR family oxidoreductase [Acidimicrobiales bacterium]|nr:SDR family oxidoreductase [Acidimicrobiales bacterium]
MTTSNHGAPGAGGASPLATASGAAPGRGRLTGRCVLIVGGGQHDYGLASPPIGNGRAMATLFAREGAAVAVADIDRGSAERTAELVRREGTPAAVLVGDAADEASVASMFSDARDALGGLDGAVLNVGIGAGMFLRGTTADDWDRVMAVNARSQFLGCKYALEIMAAGAVVLIGSVGAREVLPFPAYGASKAALESLCRQAAVEGAPAIRFNLVVPGLIDTSLGRQASQISARREQVRIPAGRQGTAWEVAYTALFLLGEESSYITGQSVIVDGGLTIAPRS